MMFKKKEKREAETVKEKISFRFKLLAMAAGLASGFPFTVKELFVLSFVGFFIYIYLLLLFKDKDIRYSSLYSLSFCFYFTYFLSGYYFIIYMYPMDYAGISPGFSMFLLLFSVLALSTLFSLEFSFTGPLAVYIIRSLDAKNMPGFIKALVFPSLFVFLEWIQTLSWAGVPLISLAETQRFFNLFLQSASLFGSLFIGFVVTLVASLASFCVKCKDRRKLYSVLSLSVFAWNALFGAVYYYLIPYSVGPSADASPLQGNLSTLQGVENMSFSSISARYRELAADAVDEGADLLLFPECAIPTYLNSYPEKISYFTDLARNNNVYILISGYTLMNNNDGELTSGNSIYFIGPDGQIGDRPYIKRKLVPFGEYVPMRGVISAVFPFLTEIRAISTDGGYGSSSSLFETEYGKIGSLVCYDSVYSYLARESVLDGANLLTVSTDDSWFKNSPESDIHLSHSALRAIETGRYLVRAANTGISAVISPRGDIISRTDLDEPGYLISEIKYLDSMTLYDIIGDTFIIIVSVFLVMCLTLSVIMTVKKRKREV